MLKKSVFLFTLCSLFLTLDAAVQHCHTGVILGAQLTKANVKITDLPALAFPDMPQKKVFAVLTFKPDDLRDLSIFDYSIEINGYVFPCVAIFRNNRFEYFTDDIRSTAVQQMLFIIDSTVIPSGNSFKAILKSNLSSEKDRLNVTLPISVIGDRPPTPLKNIPARGILELK